MGDHVETAKALKSGIYLFLFKRKTCSLLGAFAKQTFGDSKAYGKYILEKNKDKFKEPSAFGKWMFDGGGRKIGFFLQGLANSPFNIAKYPTQWLGIYLV